MLQRRFQGLLPTLVLLAMVPAWAQDTGVLSGTVTDTSGAVVVNAQVTAVNVANNFETVTVTNTEGIYRIPFLRPGTYRVRITASGFKTFVRDGLELRVGATMPINAAMEVGALAESVQVTAAAPLLETETSTTGTIVNGEFFQRMPLYQRHSRAVLYLTPGVNAGGLAYAGSLGGFSINGGATGNIGYFEDGMYGVQPSGTNTTDTILSTIEEAKVITTALPAEYGHSAGGAIVVVKKSGTNQLHGGGGTLFREGPDAASPFHAAGEVRADRQQPPFLPTGLLHQRSRLHSQTLQRQEQDLLHVRRPVPDGTPGRADLLERTH